MHACFMTASNGTQVWEKDIAKYGFSSTKCQFEDLPQESAYNLNYFVPYIYMYVPFAIMQNLFLKVSM